MTNEHDHKTGDLVLSPNARRQAAYAKRQRALGRKKFSYWMHPEEATQVSLLLERLRARQDETDPSSQNQPGQDAPA